MKKIIFITTFALSIYIVFFCFKMADMERGYNSTGGEVFTAALPLWIVRKELQTMGQKKR